MNLLINLENIKHNIRKIKTYTKKGIIAVVKSNAYGLGAAKIIKTLLKEKVNYFFFNKLSEYLNVKELLKDSNVMIFESLSVENICKYYTSNMILTINSYDDLINYQKTNINIRVHLQVDTGMNRIGIRTKEEANKIIQNKSDKIYIEGIYTHYASGKDEYDYFSLQQQKFNGFLKLYDFKIIHSNASSSLHKNIIGNYVRVGMALYGYHCKLNLKPSVNGYVKVINILKLEKDSKVGYGGLYQTSKQENIALLDFGYFDSSLIKHVYLNNKKYMFLGKTCMNHSYVLVDNKINNLSHLRLFNKFDIIDSDRYDYYKILTSFNHIKKNYIERI